jgi:hypothetical protein
MGWFSRNRRPFSKAFLERLDRIEAAVESLVEPETAFEVPAPEVIPAEIISSRTVGGVEEFAWREVTTEPNDTGGRASEGFDAAGAADAYAFAAKAADESQSFVIKHWVATTDGGNAIHDARYTLLSGDTSFWAEITGSTPVSSFAQWTYAWTEVEMQAGAFAAKTGGRGSAGVGVARNSLEDGNTAASAYGIAVTAGALGVWYVHDTDNQFQFLPVPDGAVVRMRIETHDGVAYPVFAAPNPIDGIVECPEDPPP